MAYQPLSLPPLRQFKGYHPEFPQQGPYQPYSDPLCWEVPGQEIVINHVEKITDLSKLDGYVDSEQLVGGPGELEEEIVVDDDDTTPYDFMPSSMDNLRNIYTRPLHRSPSPIQCIRPPIRRDRSEIGKKQRCLVCETVTQGFHFGAVSCAACSAFFRRTISERREYTCRVEGDGHLKCEINAEHRCYCRACRFQKCLTIGMDPLAVQPHRDQIGAKRKANGQPHSIGSPAMGDNPSSPYFNAQIDEVMSGRMAVHLSSGGQLREFKPHGAATQALLSQSNASYAEQLVALSRRPVIGGHMDKRPRLDHSISPGGSEENELEHLTTEEHQRIIYEEEKVLAMEGTSGDTEYMIMETFPFDDGQDAAVAAKEWMNNKKVPRLLYKKEELDESLLPPKSVNMIEVMVLAYEKLWERRRLLYCPDTIRDILGTTPPVSRPADLGARMQKQRLRQEVGLVAEFLSVLSPFTRLDLDDKIALFKHLSCPYSILEKHYVTMRRGGLQMNRIIHNDNSYTDLSDSALDRIKLEGSKDPLFADKATLKKLFIDPLRESLQEVTAPMFNMKMTDVEFCALVAVILFDPTTSGLSDATRAQVRAARARVYQDWFAYYRARGITSDCSQRAGNTMLLLPAVQTTVEKSHENYHVVRVFDLFEYDKILDEMMMK
ncbi:unnamed protein product, partial [Mesorhabditis spiculigera]